MGSKSDRNLGKGFTSNTNTETKLENIEIVIKVVLYDMGRRQISIDHSIS